MQLFLYIRDPEAYHQGKYSYCFSVETDRAFIDRVMTDWIFACEFEADINVDDADIAQAAITAIDNEITETRARLQGKVNELETRKANLLSLEHKTEIPA